MVCEPFTTMSALLPEFRHGRRILTGGIQLTDGECEDSHETTRRSPRGRARSRSQTTPEAWERDLVRPGCSWPLNQWRREMNRAHVQRLMTNATK